MYCSENLGAVGEWVDLGGGVEEVACEGGESEEGRALSKGAVVGDLERGVG
jgi:hypothetical protein